MRKLTQICLLTTVAVGLAMPLRAAEQKIATINLGRVFDTYYKTVQSTTALKQEAAEVQKEHALMVENGRKHKDEWRRLFDKSNDQAVSAEERAKGRKAAEEKYAEVEADEQAINAFDREADARLREKERLRRDDIVKEIRGVVDARAKAAGYTLVLDTSGQGFNTLEPVILYSSGLEDISDAIIKELNAAAPTETVGTPNAVVPAPTGLTNAVPPAK